MKSALTIFWVSLFITSCSVQQPGYSPPLLISQHQYEILQTKGSIQDIYPFDYNMDGQKDLFVVGSTNIRCFLSTPQGIETTASFYLQFDESLIAFDIVKCPGYDNSWLVVIVGSRVLFFPNLEAQGQTIATIPHSDITAKFFAAHRKQLFFYDLNQDGLSDIVVPYRSPHSWSAQIYLRKGEKFACGHTVVLGCRQNILPPTLLFLEPLRQLIVEDAGKLRFYQQHANGMLSKQPAKIVSLNKLVGEENSTFLNIMGMAQLNRQRALEMVIGAPKMQRMWVISENYRLCTLDIPGDLNLGIAFKDCNGDGWEDILCITFREPSLMQFFISYLSKNIPVPLNVCIFLNNKGFFNRQPSQILQRQLSILNDPAPMLTASKLIVEDIDDDGLPDGVTLDISGVLVYHYNILDIIPDQENIDWLYYRLLKPVYHRLAYVYWPSSFPDYVLKVPNPQPYLEITPILLNRRGKDSQVILHYKAAPGYHDLIVVVLPMKQTFLKKTNFGEVSPGQSLIPLVQLKYSNFVYLS